MSKIKELQFSDECANCKLHVCSICGHMQKRADAIDKHEKLFKPFINKLSLFLLIMCIVGIIICIVNIWCLISN